MDPRDVSAIGVALIFNGVRPFIDGRVDLYGDDFMARYYRISSTDLAELKRVLAEYRIAWTIFASNNRIIPLLDEMPGWKRLVDADGVIVHARAN